MPKQTLDLLMRNLGNLDSLTKAQIGEIVAALKAYDFADAESDDWRDNTVEALEAGDIHAAAVGAALALTSGRVTLRACP